MIVNDVQSALQSLQDVKATRLAMADKAVCPPAYHAAVGALMGVNLAGQAAPSPWQIFISLGVIAGVLWLATWSRRRTGYFINGLRWGRTLWVTGPLVLLMLAGFAAAAVLKLRYGLWWAPIPIGAVLGFVTFLSGFGWQRMYRREMLAA